MRINNAYVVDINFDGDIHSSVSGLHVFAGDDALLEVKEIIKTALTDLNNGTLKRYNRPTSLEIYNNEYSVAEVIEDDQLLEEWIEIGGDCFGNWEIMIQQTN